MPAPWSRMLTEGGLDALVVEGAPWARAFARVTPTAALVPALAIRGAPAALRGAIAVALAAPIAGAFSWSPADGPLIGALLGDLFGGVPLAIAIATPLWMAAHVGALADQLRGTPEATIAPPPAAEGARGPLAMLASLLAASAWIGGGGTVRALLLLKQVSAAPADVAPWALAVRALADGLRVSIALGAGVLVAAVALEAALLSIGRAAAPIPVQPLAMVARPLVAVVALTLSIEVAIVSLVR
ncbi:MAG: flagellar biosynthetic protein FliR [Deltaproteobacteria bacterium]|nr:flagellar biosynthetic protein FliR [Deltaproteobacteria bacterium]